MADPIDAFLTGGGAIKPAGPREEGLVADPLDTFLTDMVEIGRRNAKLNLFGAKDVKPDTAARAQELGREVGLPPETVERNLATVEQQAKAARQDKILRDNPALVRWLQDGANARIAHDDFEKLGFFEKTWSTMARSWTDAQLSNERNRLGYEGLMGAETPQGRQRIADIDKRLRAPQGGSDSTFQQVVKATAGLVGGFAEQATSKPVVAATTLGIGIGAVAGPLDFVTVPAGAAAGFLGGLVADGFQVGAGQIWLALKDMKDTEGHAIEEPIAIGASVAGGLVIGMLNAVGFRGAGRPVAEGAQALVRMAVEDALKVPTARAALAQFGTGLAKSAATGAGFGALNEGTMILAEQIARGASDGSFPTVLDSPEERRVAQERILHSMVDMAMGFGTLGFLGHGTGLVSDMSRARQAARDGAFLDQLGTAAADSATRRRAPDAFARFVEQQSEGSPIETLYIPATKVRELYQKYGLDPFELADDADPLLGFVPDRRRQLEQGLHTNGDVAVPLAQYIAKLSGTDVHATLKDDIRVRPDGMTLREAREFQEHYAAALATRGEEVRANATAAAEQAKPGMAVMDDALRQLRAAGYTLDTARQYAALLTARYSTRAARRGTDAMTEYRRSGIEVEQVLPERLRKYTPDEIDVMLGELKAAQKGPTERKLLGPTLLEHLASKGGLKDIGGDLAAMDADKWHRDKAFRPRLIREEGRGLDDAALTAFESGYFPELVGRVERPSVDQLLAAIRDELSGKERRPDVGDNADAKVQERRAAIADLDRVLNEAGIDLRQSSVKDAKAALERYQRETYGGFEQSIVAPPFFSGVERAVEGFKQAKATPQQWLGMLKNATGVKPEEMKWLGLEEWLGQQRGTVTKEQVAEFIRANKIEVQEVMKGAGVGTPSQFHIDALADFMRNAHGMDEASALNLARQAARGESAAIRRLERMEGPDELFEPFMGDIPGQTRYGNYTLPGGENYRELLLTLPPKSIESVRMPQQEGIRTPQEALEFLARRDGTTIEEIREAYGYRDERDYVAVARASEGSVGSGNYRSSHWDEPNVLAHVRFNDRVIDGRRTLLIEEVQSDWHQQGRKYGYANEENSIQRALREERGRLEERMTELQNVETGALDRNPEYVAARNRIQLIDRDLGDPTFGARVPDAPLKTTWPEFAMKRMIRYAAENGYDKIAWVPGDVQAARYDLSQRIDAIMHRRNEDGTFTVTAHLGDAEVWANEAATAKTITETLGKEIADKITSGDGRKTNDAFAVLEGLDLKVGGEGMAAFYDKMLPNIVNKPVKKFGAKVGEEAIRVAPDAGFRIENRGGRGGEAWRIVDGREGYDEYVGHVFGSREAAETWLQQNRGQDTRVHTLDITPELRTAALEQGFSLFQAARVPVASISSDLLAPLGSDIRVLRKAALDYYREKLQTTSVEHPDLGEIHFTGRGRRHMRFSSANEDKLRLVPALPDILRSGEVISSLDNVKDRQDVISYHRILAPVELDGQTLFVVAVVERRKDGKLYYDHAAGRDEAALLAASTPGSKTGTGGKGTVPRKGRDPSYEQKVGSEVDDVNLTILDQPGDGGRVRGRIRFEDGRSVISLFQNRDLSTFIHETGHLFLEEMAADARLVDAPQQIRDDFATTLKWLGVKDAAEIKVEHHEKWARAFEAYAMEGKAPSAELGGIFQRFKSWLLSIYRTVAALKTPINDEVRGVMDRLIATDEEIGAARESIAERQLFGSPEQAGMTDAEFGAYNRAVERARSRAETELLRKVMGDVRRRREAAWQAEADTVREEVRKEIDRRADIAALQFLRSGRLPDQVEGVDLPALKLSRDALVMMYGGDGILALLPRGVPPFVIAKGGVHPDVVAETIGGFRSGRDMVDALLSLEDQQRQLRERGERKAIRSWLIDQETDRRMVDRHGDMLRDGSIQEEALAVLHNEDALAVHAVELRALGRRAGLSREATPLDLARKWAADAIADKPVKEATVLGNYRRAETMAARAVESALLKGDYAEAFRQKQSQMLASALYSEARKAADDVESGQRMLNRYAGADTLKAMDQDYLEQIHGLLERFDFRPTTGKEVRRRRSFAEWATEQQANGVDVVAPASLLSDAFRTHYTQMTVAEFRGLVDGVKQIAHLGRLKKELIVNAEKREFEAVVQETVDRLDQLPQRDPADDINPNRARGLPGVTTAVGTYARKVNAAMLKMETIFEWLDAKEIDGPFNRVVWEPIARAQHERNDLMKDYTGKLVALRKGLDKETQRRMADKVDVPELVNPETGRAYTMRLEEVAAIALNWGNDGNREKLLKGYRWSEQGVQAVLDRHMTPDLWRFVQGSWDLIETLWPRIEALERKVNGVAPDKVERVEVNTAHGRFAGGYYPVVYDPLKSFDAAERAARNTDSLFENIYTRATTPKGFTKEREDSYARPIFLSLDVIPRHVAEVIHDITHREALMQADKFLGNREVMKAVEGTLGREYVEQFRPWLQNIANEYAQDRRELSAWDAMSKWGRTRATMVGLGFRLTTMLAQPLGLFDSAEAIGGRWVLSGLAEAYGNPAKWGAARDFVFERSGEMRNRMNETERDVRDAMRELLGQNGWVADARRFAYYGIAMMDMAVGLPTWLGAYKKALHEGAVEADAISLADRAVRDSQGASSAKDMAAVQRGSEFMKLATMFYSYFSHFYQRQADVVRSARNMEGVGDIPHLLARTFFLMVAPALGSAIVTGHGPKEDEDWGAWAVRKVGLGLFNGVPGARDIANVIDNDLGGEYARGYQFTPAARLVDTVWKTAKDVGNVVSGGEASERWLQHALETSGYVFGLPLGQAGQTAQFLYNVREGLESPDSIHDWLKGLTFGKTHDK